MYLPVGSSLPPFSVVTHIAFLVYKQFLSVHMPQADRSSGKCHKSQQSRESKTQYRFFHNTLLCSSGCKTNTMTRTGPYDKKNTRGQSVTDKCHQRRIVRPSHYSGREKSRPGAASARRRSRRRNPSGQRRSPPIDFSSISAGSGCSFGGRDASLCIRQRDGPRELFQPAFKIFFSLKFVSNR
jgi:hypothetical protein